LLTNEKRAVPPPYENISYPLLLVVYLCGDAVPALFEDSGHAIFVKLVAKRP
jgi:uncharacterized membrane protein YhfC